MTDTTVWLTPVKPVWPGLPCHLLGDAKLSESGTMAWTVIDRPRRKSFTEFTGVQLIQMDLPLMLDGADHDISIEPLCAALDSWRYPAPATGQPPVLTVTGPVPQPWGNPNWVIQTCAWAEAIRRRDGQRIQQTVTLTLLEYETTTVGINSPAAAAQERQAEPAPYVVGVSGPALPHPPPPPPPGGHRLYVVHGGDVLAAIAARELGDFRRWIEIATLNDIRDPRAIRIGDVLLLP